MAVVLQLCSGELLHNQLPAGQAVHALRCLFAAGVWCEVEGEKPTTEELAVTFLHITALSHKSIYWCCHKSASLLVFFCSQSSSGSSSLKELPLHAPACNCCSSSALCWMLLLMASHICQCYLLQ
jgi:hypothetical protein